MRVEQTVSQAAGDAGGGCPVWASSILRRRTQPITGAVVDHDRKHLQDIPFALAWNRALEIHSEQIEESMRELVKPYDVVVIGGGPSGLMAAVAARALGARTLLVEKGDKLGRKLGISGGGRCNVTNAKPLPELMQNIPGNGRFLYSALSRFSNLDIIAFFEGLGIALKEEDRGRVFPISDKAATVVAALVDHVYDVGAEVWTETPVRRLLFSHGRIQGLELASEKVIEAQTIVIAAGGCSVPHTGSTGDAYPWARAAGHTIVEPYPTEVPLTSHAWWIRSGTVQGLSLRQVELTVLSGKKRLTTETGDMIFTHFGLSGPAALRCSHYVSTELRKDANTQLMVHVRCLAKSDAEVTSWLEAARRHETRKQVRTVLLQLLPERLTDLILRETGVPGDVQMANLANDVLRCLVETITGLPVPITGTLPLKQATVTGGGVSVKEIDPKTMASKCVNGLFFSGEVMDVHAHTGGYNITVAFSTGHCAGTNAALYAQTVDAIPDVPGSG